jgi:pimeloyl-ACP methyl ester carboxylesterase
MQHRRIKFLGIAAAFIFVVSFIGHATLSTRAFTNPNAAPVILVHGYNGRASCPGMDLSSYWKNTSLELTTHAGIAAADVVPVSYYQCDTHGVDISGYGPAVNRPVAKTAGVTKPAAGYTNNASITLIAQDLSWFIYNEYTSKGHPVNIVGHSMGGLITREALRRVQANDPAFPPTLDVGKVLTISTPHNGWGVTCKTNTECSQMTDGSQFLADLQTNAAPQGSKGTAWYAMATSGPGVANNGFASTCDSIPTASATAVAGTHLVYTKPCYRHAGYLTDRSLKLDAQGSPELGGRHSLAMMVELMK